MNLLLFHPTEETSNNHWVLPIKDRRVNHLKHILKLSLNESVEAGVLNGKMGQATFLKACEEHWHFRFLPTTPPPPALPVTLVLALPRPKMLRRVLLDAITLGIKHIVLLNSYKVEKSYWQTPRLNQAQLNELIYIALEQAKDTQAPKIETKKYFKPFIEDELAAIRANKTAYLLHPGNNPYLPNALPEDTIIAIGPEGGWTEYETQQFILQGFTPYALGQRILRVETALPTIIGRIALLP